MENYSKQREEIIAIIKELYTHPTAEEIYFLVKQKDSAVSRSTVYRNLGFLTKKGVLNQISVSNGPDRYDYMLDRQEHGHVICKKCGKLYDFKYDFDMQKLKDSVLKQSGVDILESGIMLKGICNSCKEAQN